MFVVSVSVLPEKRTRVASIGHHPRVRSHSSSQRYRNWLAKQDTDTNDALHSFLQRVQTSPALKALHAADASWKRLQQTGSLAGRPPEQVVLRAESPPATRAAPIDFDVLVLGGTLGILVATALLHRQPKLRIVVAERGALRGRDQEWNTSRRELQTLVETGVLSQASLDSVIQTQWNSMRVGVEAPAALTLPEPATFLVDDILNIGVSPKLLIDEARRRFLSLGGSLWEWTQFVSAQVDGTRALVTLHCADTAEHRPAVALGAGSDQAALASEVLRPGAASEQTNQNPSASSKRCVRVSLVLDCMGNASPMVRQQRELIYGQKRPDAVCMVVGSCCAADTTKDPFPDNTLGDLIYSFTPADEDHQYLWEAFPSDGGKNRTTYLFTYLDVDPRRKLSLADMYRDYLEWLPRYQGGDAFARGDPGFVTRLRPQRALFGFFPSYTKYAPLPTAFDNILPIGDASGIQSPLSFGGFGALLRHLPRLVDAITEALEAKALSAKDLQCIQPYLPSLSVTWLFQRALSYRLNRKARQHPSDRVVNEILGWSLLTMQQDPAALRPFLQDVIQFPGLTRTLARMTMKVPGLVPRILHHIGGPAPLVSWLGHFIALGAYDGASRLFPPQGNLTALVTAGLRDPKQRFRWRRQLEAWQYGSGLDLHQN